MKIYIVIPVHNRLALTKKCLASIAKQSYKNFKVIVVNDGSLDGTQKYIRDKHPEYLIIRGTGNWWWTRSMFEGVKEALKTAKKGDFVLSMNNDCYFKRNYLKEMVAASVENKRTVVGSLILDADKPTKVMDAGVKIVWERNMIYGVADKISDKIRFYDERKIIKDVDTLPGKGTLIPIEVFKKAGSFNYRRLPHYIADYEFFCRAKRHGFKLIVSSKVRLYNFFKETGSSHIEGERAGFKRIWHLLFDRKSKLNIVDYTNFLLLCCPKKYLWKNLRDVFWRMISYLLMLFPFYYLPPGLYKFRLFFHNLPLFFRQNPVVYKFKLFFHNLPLCFRQNPKICKFKLFFHNLSIVIKQHRLVAGWIKRDYISVSYGYQQISKIEAKRLRVPWSDYFLSKGQWRIVKPLIDRQEVPEVAKPAVEIIKQLNLKRLRLLDVGCSSGYYLSFFKIAKIKLDYFGCDISPHFIRKAKRLHPKADFRKTSMLELPYNDEFFDVVLASASLQHSLEYEKAFKELVRVSSRYILLHRLPVFNKIKRSTYYKKIGYGVEMMEIVFAWKKLKNMFTKNNLKVVKRLKINKLDIKISAYWNTVLLDKLDR